MKTRLLISFVLVIFGVGQTVAQKDTIPDSRYYPSTGKSKNIVLVLLGGSEGGLPNYYNIDKLTGAGYSCFILGYFGTRNTPERLEMIPMEYFERALNDLENNPELKGRKIVVWGGSKGGELSLLLASKFKQIRGVIAAVPGSVVFQGLGGNPVSSWSEHGRSLPFVPFPPYDYSKIVNSQYVEVYRLALEQSEAVSKATIPVENINGPVLLLAGKEDTMWPSDAMCRMIMKRLADKHFKYPYQLFSYDHAGHTLNDGYMMGGTAEGNSFAKVDSEKRIFDFLDRLSKQ